MRIGIDASRAFVQHRTGTETYSLNIIRNLLALDTVIEPYSMTLNDMSKFQRDVWGREVAQQLKQHYEPEAPLLRSVEWLAELERERRRMRQLVFLCGKNYHQPIISELWAWRKAGVEMETPLSDVGGIGYQLQFLTQELERVAAASAGGWKRD